MKKQKEVTAEQIYRANKKRVKILKVINPFVFWSLLIVTLVFLYLALKNSIGNVLEINRLLSVDSESQRQLNYDMLISKWGKWYIVGDGKGLMDISFVNIPKAMFSGLMITYTTLTIVFFMLLIGLNKIIIPALIKMYTNNNDELVDLATLNTLEQVNEIAGKKEKNKKTKKEWF